MPRNDSRPATNAATASSLAALNIAGTTPPASPACRASRTAGKATSSSGANSQVLAVDQSSAGCTPGSRSGQARASAIGSRMSGGLACAIVAPSAKVDHRVDDRLRVHHDVDVGVGDVEEQVRLDQLEALVDQRRGVDRDHRAHVPGRVGERLLGAVTSASSSAARPRNGPPLAVSTSRATSPRAPPRRHWASAECSESTGTSCPGAAAARDQVAAGDQRLLVGQRDGAPGPQRREGRAQPDRAGDAVEDDVGRAGRPAPRRPAARPGSPAACTRPAPSRAAGPRRRTPAAGPARRWPGRRRRSGRRARAPARRAARRRRRRRPAR